ncbi:MAG: hypothetical protein ACTSVI_14940 [Promethearchaeota archaeon]
MSIKVILTDFFREHQDRVLNLDFSEIHSFQLVAIIQQHVYHFFFLKVSLFASK